MSKHVIYVVFFFQLEENSFLSHDESNIKSITCNNKINTYKELISTLMNTMYKWEEKNNNNKKVSRHHRPLFLFQISYKQTLSIVVYFVPKQ